MVQAIKELYEQYAFLLLQNLPRASYVSIDQHAYRTDTLFEGFKLVPPGIHCLTWQSAGYADDRQDSLATEGIRSALFLYTKENDVLARTYDPASDTWLTPPGTDASTQLLVSRDHLQSMDKSLAPYPVDDYALWQSMTRYLQKSRATLARIFHVDAHTGDAMCDSFTSMSDREARVNVHDLRHTYRSQTQDKDSSLMSSVPSLAFTPFSLAHSWPPDAHGAERTRWSMDKSWLLEDVMSRACAAEHHGPSLAHEPLLREFELSFLLFRCTNNAAALDHWAAIISLFCRAASYLGAPAPHALHPCEWDVDRPASTPYATPSSHLEAHIGWLEGLVAQWQALPPHIWTDDLASYEAPILDDLACLRANIGRSLSAWAAVTSSTTTDHERLVNAWRDLSSISHARFAWSLDQLLDEEVEADDFEEGADAPVIVHI